jgi:hypothetical protein
MHNIDAVADYPGVQLSWKRILSIAQNTPDPATAAVNYEDEEEPEESTVTRMQSMGRALQNMFTITSQGNNNSTDGEVVYFSYKYLIWHM